MQRAPLLAITVLVLAALSLGQDVPPRVEQRSATPGFPDPVDVLGVRLAMTNLSATINVQSPPAPKSVGPGEFPAVSRSMTVTGSVTPLMLLPAQGGEPRATEGVGPPTVLRAEVTALAGDGRVFDLAGAQRGQPAGGVARERMQLSQALLNNPHMLLQPPPGASREQFAMMRYPTTSFNAYSQLDALPGHIDRLEVRLDLVHAAEMDVVTLPLEAMAEHKGIAPGVRFLVRDVRGVEHGGRPYTRVEIEYFIDREHAEEDAGFEATPLVPAVAIRDGRGQIVHMLQRVQETETRDQFIVSIGDISLGADAGKAGPLTVDVVVLHGLERRSVEMVIEDLPLAGG